MNPCAILTVYLNFVPRSRSRPVGTSVPALASFTGNGDCEESRLFTLHGRIYSHYGQDEKELADFSRSLTLHSADVSTLPSRADTFLLLHRSDEALRDYNRCLSLQPDDLIMLSNRAAALRSG